MLARAHGQAWKDPTRWLRALTVPKPAWQKAPATGRQTLPFASLHLWYLDYATIACMKPPTIISARLLLCTRCRMRQKYSTKAAAHLHRPSCAATAGLEGDSPTLAYAWSPDLQHWARRNTARIQPPSFMAHTLTCSIQCTGHSFSSHLNWIQNGDGVNSPGVSI